MSSSASGTASASGTVIVLRSSSGVTAMRSSLSSSLSTYSMMPACSRQVHTSAPGGMEASVCASRPMFSSTKRGLIQQPLSLCSMTPLAMGTTEVSKGRFMVRRARRAWVTSVAGSGCTPMMSPFTSTKQCWRLAGEACSKGTTPRCCTNTREIMADGVPMRTWVSTAKFFTRPQPLPSGVSDGHRMPQCDTCACRMCVALPSRHTGVLTRRICDCSAMWLMRWMTWVTPTWVPLDRCVLQLPVRKAKRSAAEILRLLTASARLR